LGGISHTHTHATTTACHRDCHTRGNLYARNAYPCSLTNSYTETHHDAKANLYAHQHAAAANPDAYTRRLADMINQHIPQQPHPQPGSQPMPAPVLPLEVWGATDKGREREGNEDAVYPHSGADTFPFEPSPDRLAQKGQLLVVADGVGGAQAGSEASRWAIRVAVERYYDLPGPDLGADLRAAIEVANASLYQYLQSTNTTEAGCTMTAAVIHAGRLHVANVGDSRAYLLRNGQIAQLTRDHTLTQRKIEQGLIQAEQAEMDPDRSVLTRSLGAGPTVQVDLFPPQQLVPGDGVLLCSDGLTDMLADEEIARLANGGSLKRSAHRLIAAANKRGGFDNISVVVTRVGEKKPSPGGGALGGLRKLQSNIRGMSRRQKIALLVGAVLVVATFCALAALGWRMRAQSLVTLTPTPVPTVTIEGSPTATVPVTVPDTPRPTDTTGTGGQPTSTPRPTATATPTHTPVPDRDKDDVPDPSDDCPDEPGLPALGGCPDGDGDGVRDDEDKCPDKPGRTEWQGCPDSDGDGIPDHQDQCPGQSGPADNGGCPREKTGGGDDGGDGGGGDGGGDGGDGGGGKKPPPPPPPP
jgi:serine/threonine protein phosphatase PrpC/uncharacterized membrane protein YgcG